MTFCAKSYYFAFLKSGKVKTKGFFRYISNVWNSYGVEFNYEPKGYNSCLP